MIFVDSGAFLARYIQRDQHHAAAIAMWESLASSNLECCTSSFVLSETITLLARRTDYRFAAERARQIYSSVALQILRTEARDEAAAVITLEEFADQKVSFCDCVSFVLMRKHGIQEAFTFDSHFTLAGFTAIPAIA